MITEINLPRSLLRAAICSSIAPLFRPLKLSQIYALWFFIPHQPTSSLIAHTNISLKDNNNACIKSYLTNIKYDMYVHVRSLITRERIYRCKQNLACSCLETRNRFWKGHSSKKVSCVVLPLRVVTLARKIRRIELRQDHSCLFRRNYSNKHQNSEESVLGSSSGRKDFSVYWKLTSVDDCLAASELRIMKQQL